MQLISKTNLAGLFQFTIQIICKQVQIFITNDKFKFSKMLNMCQGSSRLHELSRNPWEELTVGILPFHFYHLTRNLMVFMGLTCSPSTRASLSETTQCHKLERIFFCSPFSSARFLARFDFSPLGQANRLRFR